MMMINTIKMKNNNKNKDKNLVAFKIPDYLDHDDGSFFQQSKKTIDSHYHHDYCQIIQPMNRRPQATMK